MRAKTLIPIIIFLAILAASNIVAADVTSTGYYLPQGYKVSAKVNVPVEPFWPGEAIGDAVGVSTSGYQVIIRGYASKGGIVEGFAVEKGIKVIWVQGGKHEEKAKITGLESKEHDVEILYGYDGQVKISVNGEFLYSFVATVSKYEIVAEGAKVNQPEPLPSPTTTPTTGEGYSKPSTYELQQQLALGLGGLAIAILALLMFMKGKKPKLTLGKISSAIIIALLLLGMAALGTYIIYEKNRPHVGGIPLPPWQLSEEIGPYPVLTKTTIGKLEPGTVWQVKADIQGWQIQEKQTTLYEKLVLDNVDLQPNDVVSWHGWVWWFGSSANGNVEFDFPDSIAKELQLKLSWITMFRESPNPDDRIRLGGGSNYITYYADFQGEYLRLTFGFINLTGTAKVWLYSFYPDIKYESDLWYVASVNYVANASITFYLYNMTYLASGTVSISDEMQYPLSRVSTGCFYGYCPVGYRSYMVIYARNVASDTIENVIQGKVDSQDLALFADPTFYNGTHYIDIASNSVGTPNNVLRIPAEQPFLWYIKSLKSDNKLHLMWFPAGSIIRIKDSNGNLIREFTITGNAVNEDGQVEDYAIDLNADVIAGASIEAYVPSMKIRVYGPYGSIVKIVGSDGTIYAEGEISGDYVDLVLQHTLENADIVISASDYKENLLDIQVVERNDGTIEITVMDDKGVLIPGILVRVADPSGVVFYSALTGQDGKVSFKPNRPLPEATIEASGIWQGTIHYTSKTVQLSVEQIEAPPSSTSNELMQWIALGLGIIVIAAFLMLIMSKRR